MKSDFPNHADIPEAPETFADHLRVQRLRRNLTQKQLAEVLGVNECTIYNWERGLHHPPAHQCNKAIEFIGHDPFPLPTTLPERMISFRRLSGLRVKDAAALARVDPSSWSNWERDVHQISVPYRERIEALLNGSISAAGSGEAGSATSRATPARGSLPAAT